MFLEFAMFIMLYFIIFKMTFYKECLFFFRFFPVCWIQHCYKGLFLLPKRISRYIPQYHNRQNNQSYSGMYYRMLVKLTVLVSRVVMSNNLLQSRLAMMLRFSVVMGTKTSPWKLMWLFERILSFSNMCDLHMRYAKVTEVEASEGRTRLYHGP